LNFFDAQDQARRATRWLVVVYVVSTALIVAGVTAIVAGTMLSFEQDGSGLDVGTLIATAAASAVFIFGASLYKTAALSSGGGRVAKDMGGVLVPTDVNDPARRQLRNVVEEMAIASGVPVPEIYVLEAEAGINAFAAGYNNGDAAIAVTRGTLEMLNREELQGVIAHEFSHVLNGDMRLNIRMMGVLFGILVIGIVGRMVLRGSHHSGVYSGRRDRGAPVVLLTGIGLTLLGWIGVFLARVIKAAVSRQREFLADASAVQFTRQTEGIAGALKKIGGFTRQSYFQQTDPEEVSHMLFAKGSPKLSSLLATHPPLADRIKALDPSFREAEFKKAGVEHAASAASGINAERAAGFQPTASPTASSTSTGTSNVESTLAPGTEINVADSVGRPTAAHMRYARALRESIPPLLYDAAHSPDDAYLLTVALIVDDDVQDRQLAIVASHLGADSTAKVGHFVDALHSLDSRYRLPLLEIAFPELKQRPGQALEFLLDLIRKLIDVDGQVDLREFCFYRTLTRHLQQAGNPASERGGNRIAQRDARTAAITLIRVVANEGHRETDLQDEAFRAGVETFGAWAGQQKHVAGQEKLPTVADLDHALAALAKINSAGQQTLLKALTRTIAYDGRLSTSEAELLRAICASLDCPLPPLLDAVVTDEIPDESVA